MKRAIAFAAILLVGSVALAMKPNDKYFAKACREATSTRIVLLRRRIELVNQNSDQATAIRKEIAEFRGGLIAPPFSKLFQIGEVGSPAIRQASVVSVRGPEECSISFPVLAPSIENNFGIEERRRAQQINIEGAGNVTGFMIAEIEVKLIGVSTRGIRARDSIQLPAALEVIVPEGSLDDAGIPWLRPFDLQAALAPAKK